MLLTADMPNAKDFEVRDFSGRMLGGVLSYDTVIKEIEMYVFDNRGFPVLDIGKEEPIKVRFVLEGSYAVDKKTGEKITECNASEMG